MEEPGQNSERVSRGGTLLSKKLVQLAIAVGAVLVVALLVSLGFALRWYLTPPVLATKPATYSETYRDGKWRLPPTPKGAPKYRSERYSAVALTCGLPPSLLPL